MSYKAAFYSPSPHIQKIVNMYAEHALFLPVLFIADVKVTFDDFKKCMIATCDQKTIIIANPGKQPEIAYIK